MWRFLPALVFLAAASPGLALAQPLPSMSEGYTVEPYASVPDPVNLSIAPDGTIFVGRDPGAGGGGTGAAQRIHRVTPGDPPVVEEFGDAVEDPDVVLADPLGLYAPEAGSVLVGGRIVALNPFAGYVAAIAPDGTTTTLLPANQTVQNPSGFGFDSGGTLWLVSFDNARLLPLGEAGPGVATVLPDEPLDLVVEPGTDRLFVSLQNGTIQIYDTGGALLDASFATGRATAFATGVNRFGTDLYVLSATEGTLSRVDAEGNATVIGTGFGDDAFGLDFGPDGRLYATDFDNDRILAVPESDAAAAALAAVALLRGRRRLSGRA